MLSHLSIRKALKSHKILCKTNGKLSLLTNYYHGMPRVNTTVNNICISKLKLGTFLYKKFNSLLMMDGKILVSNKRM